MFRKFAKIGSFSDMIYKVRRHEARSGEKSEFMMRPKIKLHGTNAAVYIDKKGNIQAQSRTRFITPDDDNYGFAAWVENNKDCFSHLRGPLYIYGEWAGPGIQSGVAVSGIESRTFFIICMVKGEQGQRYAISNPEAIASSVPARNTLKVLPYAGDPVTIKIYDSETLDNFVQTVNQDIELIDKKDPYISRVYEIDGAGEGLVYSLYDNGLPIHTKEFDEIIFKAKGEKHAVKKTNKPLTATPEQVSAASEFADMFITENRMRQGAEACGGYNMREMSNFLKWLGNDVKRESEAERESNSDLPEWKKLWGVCTKKAVMWYKNECNRI